MQIKFFVLLMLIFGNYNKAQASWNPYFMDQERFVHLSETEKREVVLKTMEVFVELESKYRHQVVTQGFKPERYKRYTQMMRKIESFLISNAVAAVPQKELSAYGRDFKKLIEGKSSDRCLYAGWISEVQGNFCVHPSIAKNPEIKAAFPKDPECKGPAKISCNPVVFGYKSNKEKSLFCVDAGLDKSHNSALSCMEESVGSKADPKEKERRLNEITLQMGSAEHKEIFNSVHKFIFQSCVCSTKTKQLNSAYQAYMRPHRTCYGMLTNLNEIHSKNLCEIDGDTSMEFFQNFKKFVNAGVNITPIEKGARTSEFEKEHYEKFINSIENKRLCGETETPPINYDLTCSSKCDWNGTEKTCVITVLKDGKAVPDRKPHTIKLKSKDESPTCQLYPDQAPYLCIDVEITPEKKVEEAIPTCSIAVSVSEDKKSISAVAKFEPEGTKPDSIVWEGASSSSETATYDFKEDVKIAVKAKFKDKEISCAGSLPESDEATDEEESPTLEIVGREISADSKTIEAVVTFKEKKEIPEGHTLIWTRSSPTDSGKEEISQGSTLSVTQPRKEVDYDVCAELVDAKKTSVDIKCDLVPKKDIVSPKARAGGGRGQMPFQMPPRPVNNTATQGIQ